MVFEHHDTHHRDFAALKGTCVCFTLFQFGEGLCFQTEGHLFRAFFFLSLFLFFWIPLSSLLCRFSAFLFFCFSALLLICFSVFFPSTLLCCFCFSAFLLFRFFCFSVFLFLCFFVWFPFFASVFIVAFRFLFLRVFYGFSVCLLLCCFFVSLFLFDSMHCICSAFVAFCFSTCFLAVLLDFTFSYNYMKNTTSCTNNKSSKYERKNKCNKSNKNNKNSKRKKNTTMAKKEHNQSCL